MLNIIMGFIMENESNEEKRYPHSPYIKERKKLDNGFSKDWGFHFQPSEDYWLDCHSHLDNGETYLEINKLLNQWFLKLDGFRLGKVLLITNNVNLFKVYKKIIEKDERFSWIFWMPFDKPDCELLQTAINHGAVGLKLHNGSIIKSMGEPKVWLTDKWKKIFRLAEKNKLPILWHVTQRVSFSPYHGGKAHSYWKEGKQKSIEFTNEDLLQVFLEVLELHPNLKFIGAHQLHIGLERLSTLLDKYDNLYIDTSCGFYVRWADVLYEKDRKILWEFFIKYKDRILFGTDSSLAPNVIDEYLVQGFLCHARFILQLRLPYNILQMISHQNSEHVFGITPVQTSTRGNVRP